MGEVEKAEEKKKEKGKKAKNKIAINPDTDDEKNKYEEVNAKKLAENLGADLQSLKIEDADGDSSAWRTYRQQLRDITKASDIYDVTWPTKPS